MFVYLIRVTRRWWVLRAVLLLSGALIILSYFQAPSRSIRTNVRSNPKSHLTTEDRNFERLLVSGYANLDSQNEFACVGTTVTNELSITPITEIDDDLYEIAKTITHPLVDYSTQEQGISFKELIDRTWSRSSSSSVWLEEYQVFLTVSRVYFYDRGVKSWSVVSFIRAQIHDAEWNHVPSYKLAWQGQLLTFPRILEVDFPFEIGSCFIGPEDPRIIIERQVPNAEPVVVFNMQEDTHTLKRSMYIVRPFSNFCTKLIIDTIEHEKNWAPFFLPPGVIANDNRSPNSWLHFVHEFLPLTIVRCHLFSGICLRVYVETPPTYLEHGQDYDDGFMAGGSNFEPVHISGRPGIHSFVGFPRTHIDQGCFEGSMYRPELVILSTDGNDFWFDYTSESLNFGTSMLNSTQLEEPCQNGRVLMINSIADLDLDSDLDSATLTYAVNDMTVGVAVIGGLRQLLDSLPQYKDRQSLAVRVAKSLKISYHLIECSIKSATDYALDHTDFKMREPERVRKAKGKIEERKDSGKR